EETLNALQHKNLVTRVQGGRVERWRHNLYEHWTSEKVDLSVITELLLRGPQTEGELRGRASRMEPIEDLEALRNVLRPLTEKGLVVFLGPEGRRGTLITHGFHTAAELESLRAQAGSREVELSAVSPLASPAPDSAFAEFRAELAELRNKVQKLETA